MRSDRYKTYCYSADKEFMRNVIREVLRNATVVIKANPNDENIENLLLRYIKPEEKKEADKFCFNKDKVNHVVSRGIVNHFYKTLENKNINEIEWRRDSKNKPKIDNSFRIQFNISHTDGCVLIGFSKKAIGVDVEKINYKFEHSEILNTVFTDKEIRFIGKDILGFYNFWVAKEAYLKATGDGLIRNPREIEVMNVSEGFIRIRDIKNINPTILRRINIENKYVGAACIMEEK